MIQSSRMKLQKSEDFDIFTTLSRQPERLVLFSVPCCDQNIQEATGATQHFRLGSASTAPAEPQTISPFWRLRKRGAGRRQQPDILVKRIWHESVSIRICIMKESVVAAKYNETGSRLGAGRGQEPDARKISCVRDVVAKIGSKAN